MELILEDSEDEGYKLEVGSVDGLLVGKPVIIEGGLVGDRDGDFEGK